MGNNVNSSHSHSSQSQHSEVSRYRTQESIESESKPASLNTRKIGMKTEAEPHKVNKLNLKKAIAYQDKLKADIIISNMRSGRFQDDHFLPMHKRSNNNLLDKYSPDPLINPNQFKRDEEKAVSYSQNMQRDPINPVNFNEAISNIMNKSTPSNSNISNQIPSVQNTLKSVSFNFDAKNTLPQDARNSEKAFSFVDTPDWRLSARNADGSLISTVRYDTSNLDTLRFTLNKPPLGPENSILESTKRASSLDNQFKKLVLRPPSPNNSKNVPGSRESVQSNSSFEQIIRPLVPGITPTNLNQSNPSIQPTPLQRSVSPDVSTLISDRSKSPRDPPAKKHKLLLSSGSKRSNPPGYDSLSSTSEYIANYMSGPKTQFTNISSPVASYMAMPLYNNPFQNDSRVENSSIRDSIHNELLRKLPKSSYDGSYTPAKSTNVTTNPSANQTLLEERPGRFSDQKDSRAIPFTLAKIITEESLGAGQDKHLATIPTISASDSKEIGSNLVTVPSQKEHKTSEANNNSFHVEQLFENLTQNYNSENHQQPQPLSAFQSGNSGIDIYKRLEEILKGTQNSASKERGTQEERTFADVSATNNQSKENQVAAVFIRALQSPSESTVNFVSPPDTKKNAEELTKWGFASFAKKNSNEESKEEPRFSAQNSKEFDAKSVESKIYDGYKFGESVIVNQFQGEKSPRVMRELAHIELIRQGSSLDPKSPQSYLTRNESRETAFRDVSPSKKTAPNTNANLPSLPSLSSMSSQDNPKGDASPSHTVQNIHEIISSNTFKKQPSPHHQSSPTVGNKSGGNSPNKAGSQSPIKSGSNTPNRSGNNTPNKSGGNTPANYNPYRASDYQDSIRQVEEKTHSRQHSIHELSKLGANSTNTSYELTKMYSGLLQSPSREYQAQIEEDRPKLKPLASISEKNEDHTHRSADKEDISTLTEKKLQEMQELFMHKIESVHKDLLHKIELIGVLAAGNNNLQPVSQALLPQLHLQMNQLESEVKKALNVDFKSSQNSLLEIHEALQKQNDSETLQFESKDPSPKASFERSPTKYDRLRETGAFGSVSSKNPSLNSSQSESLNVAKKAISKLQAMRDQRKVENGRSQPVAINLNEITPEKSFQKNGRDSITPSKREATPTNTTNIEATPSAKDTTPKSNKSPNSRESILASVEKNQVRFDMKPVKNEPLIVKIHPKNEPSECNFSERSERRSDKGSESSLPVNKTRSDPVLNLDPKPQNSATPPKDPNLEKKLASRLQGEASPENKKLSPESRKGRSQTIIDSKLSSIVPDKSLQTIEEVTAEPNKSSSKIDIPPSNEDTSQSKDFGNISAIAREASAERRRLNRVYTMREPVLPRDLFTPEPEKKLTRLNSVKDSRQALSSSEKLEPEIKASENKTITTEMSEQSKRFEKRKPAINEPQQEVLKAGGTVSFTQTAQNFFAPWKVKENTSSPSNTRKSQTSDSEPLTVLSKLKSPDSTPNSKVDRSPARSPIRTGTQPIVLPKPLTHSGTQTLSREASGSLSPISEEPKKQLQALLKPSPKNFDAKGGQTEAIQEIKTPVKKQSTVSTNTFEDLEEQYRNPRGQHTFGVDFFGNPKAHHHRTIDTLEYTDTCLGEGTQRPELEEYPEEKALRRSPTKDLIDENDSEEEEDEEEILDGYPQQFDPEEVSQDIFNEPEKDTLRDYERILNTPFRSDEGGRYSRTTNPNAGIEAYRTPDHLTKISSALRTLSPDRIIPTFPKNKTGLNQRGTFTGIRELSDSSKKEKRTQERSPLKAKDKSPNKKSKSPIRGKEKSPIKAASKSPFKSKSEKKMKIDIPDRTSVQDEDTPQFAENNFRFNDYNSDQKENDHSKTEKKKKSKKDSQNYKHFFKSRTSSQVNLESLKQGLVEKSKLLSKFYNGVKPEVPPSGETEEESDLSKMKRIGSKGSIKSKATISKSRKESEHSSDSRKVTTEESVDMKARSSHVDYRNDEDEKRLRSEIKELRNKLKFYTGSDKYSKPLSPIKEGKKKSTKSPSHASKEAEKDKSPAKSKTPTKSASKRIYKDSPIKKKSKSPTPKKSRKKSTSVERIQEVDEDRRQRSDSNASIDTKEYNLALLQKHLAARTKLMEDAFKRAAQNKLFAETQRKNDSEDESYRGQYQMEDRPTLEKFNSNDKKRVTAVIRQSK